jgi:hypothetical protein
MDYVPTNEGASKCLPSVWGAGVTGAAVVEVVVGATATRQVIRTQVRNKPIMKLLKTALMEYPIQWIHNKYRQSL